jgi:hypothetical protein
MPAATGNTQGGTLPIATKAPAAPHAVTNSKVPRPAKHTVFK